MNVRFFREKQGKGQKELTALLKERYPGYDKALQSKVERPERYGVTWTREAGEWAKARLGAAKGDRHKLTGRLSFRVAVGEKERLQHYARLRGYESVQHFLWAEARKWLRALDKLEKRESARPCGEGAGAHEITLEPDYQKNGGMSSGTL